MRFVCLLSALLFALPSFAQTPDYVLLRNGERVEGIVSLEGQERVAVFVGNRRIDLAQVDRLQRDGVPFVRYDVVQGRGTSTYIFPILLRQVSEGVGIRFYDQYNPRWTGTDPVWEFFRKDDDAMRRVTTPALRQAFADDPPSMALLDRARTLGYAKNAAYATGTVLTIYGAVRSLGSDDQDGSLEVHLTMPIGVVVALGGVLLSGKERNTVRRAIVQYLDR